MLGVGKPIVVLRRLEFGSQMEDVCSLRRRQWIFRGTDVMVGGLIAATVESLSI